MKQYLLDTNVLIRLLRGQDDLLEKKLRKIAPERVHISTVTLYELYYGAFKSQRPAHNVALIDELKFQVLELGEQDAKESGEIRAYLTRKGMPIGPYDLLLAGQARTKGLVLVTHNTKEFSRIPKLQVEDWEK